MATQSNQPSDLWNKATLVIAGRNKKKKKKSRSLPLGSIPPQPLPKERSASFHDDDLPRVATLRDLGKLSNHEAFARTAADAISISTETTASTTTAGVSHPTALRKSTAAQGKPSIANLIPDSNFPKGHCGTCGVKTHKVSLFKITPLSNTQVSNGTCRRCAIEKKQRKESIEWETHHRRQVPSATSSPKRLSSSVRNKRSPSFKRDKAKPAYNDDTNSNGYNEGRFLQRHSSEGNFGSQNSPQLTKMMKHLAAGDYESFSKQLESTETTDITALKLGIRQFRKSVASAQLANPKTSVLKNDNWLRATVSKMNGSDEDILVECLLTFLTFSSLSGNYRKILVTKGAVKAACSVLDSMNQFPRAREVSCAFLYSMKAQEEKYQPSEESIRRLAKVVTSNQGIRAQEYAVQTLACAAKGLKTLPKDRDRFKALQAIIIAPNTVNSITSLLLSEMIHESAVEAIFYLWLLFSPSEGLGLPEVEPSEELVRCICSVLEGANRSPAVTASGFALLANLAMHDDFPERTTPHVIETLYNCLSKREETESVEIVIDGLHAISNLMSNPIRRNLCEFEGRLAGLVVACLSRYPDEQEILLISSELVEFICAAQLFAVNLFISQGGLRLLCIGLSRHQQSEGISNEVIQKSLNAIDKISRTERGAKAVLDYNFLAIFESRNTAANLNSSQKQISSIVRNAILVPLLPEEDVAFAGTFTVVHHNIFDNQVLTLSTPIPPKEIELILKQMERFEGSSLVQKVACGILAESLFLQATTISLEIPMSVLQHLVVSIRILMRRYRGVAAMQSCACCVISNLLACSSESANPEWIPLMNPFLGDTLDIFTFSQGDFEERKNAINLFWYLSDRCDRDFVEMFAPKVVEKMINSIMQHGGSAELHIVLLDFLWSLKDRTEFNASICSVSAISVFVSLLDFEDEDVATKSSFILSYILTNTREPLHSASIMKMPFFSKFNTLHGNHWQFQSNFCSILASLMSREESYEFPGLSNGCFQVLCDSLTIHSSKYEVIVPACRALVLVLPSMQEEYLGRLMPSLFSTLREIIDANLHDEQLCASCVEVLSAGCYHGAFSSRLVETAGCVEAFVRATKYHLGSTEMQLQGCTIIASLSDIGGMVGKISELGGIETILNCMLAHIDNVRLQRVALPALQNLASGADITGLLQKVSADTSVFLVLLSHYKEPRVVSHCFFTLATIVAGVKDDVGSRVDEVNLLHIMAGMRRFPFDGAVQESGCKLLQICSFNSANLETIQNHLADFLPTILRASRSFPRCCEETVSTILMMLSAVLTTTLEEEAMRLCQRSISPLLPLIAEFNVVFAFEGQRDDIVSVLGLDGKLREEPIYLRRRNLPRESSQVAYQRLNNNMRNNRCFRTQRIESPCINSYVVICSLVYKDGGDEFYHQVQDGEHRRNLALIYKYSIDQMIPSKVASGSRLFQRKLRHIVGCKEIIQDRSSMYVVYELKGLETYGYRTLKDRVLPATLDSINRFGTYTLDEKEVQRTFYLVVTEVKRLHDVGFWHGRICPEAFLDMGRDGISLRDVIGPLFFSSRPEASVESANATYAAPERNEEGDFNRFIADVWSLGATLFALLTRSELCGGQEGRSYHLFISSGGLKNNAVIDSMMRDILMEDSFEGRNRLWLNILGIRRLSAAARELLSSMLQPNPESRITIEGILRSEWMCSPTNSVGLSREKDDFGRGPPGFGSFSAQHGDGEHSGAAPKSCVGGQSRGKSGRGGSGTSRSDQQKSRRRNVGRQTNIANKLGRKIQGSKGEDSDSDDDDDHDDDGSSNSPLHPLAAPRVGPTCTGYITLIQSSPLMYVSDGGQAVPMGQLNIHEERRVLAEAIQDANADIKILFEIATTDRLGAILSKRQARVVHFSGHGHPSYLAIEDGVGGMQPLLIQDLIDLVSTGNVPNIDFVFVSACCSRSIGESLVEANVPHVVCCDQDTQQIRDDTTVAFQKALYRALACGNTLRTAFLRARKEIQYSSMLPKDQLEAEMAKFCLLPEDGDHDVQIFCTGKDSDVLGDISSDICQARIPPPPSPFVGRQVETYNISCALNKARLVRVSGEKGIGKKSLCRFLCRFVDDRRHIQKFDDVLWYPNPIGNPNILLNQLFENLYDYSQTEEETEKVMNKIIQHLYNRRLLLVLEADGSNRLFKFLLRLFHHNESVKVILIHSDGDLYAQRSIMPCLEHDVRVPKLDIESNVILFCNMCPIMDNPKKDKDRILNAYADKPLWRKDIERMIGDGVPSRILQSSKEITEAGLTKLLEIGECNSLDNTFQSRADLLETKKELERAKSDAIRNGDYKIAGDLQFQLDEVEKLKEEFPSIETMETRKADMLYHLRKLVNQDLYGSAARLRMDLDKLEERILTERAAMESKSPPCKFVDDVHGYTLEKLKSSLTDLNARLRLALDENDFASAKEINDKIKIVEKRKSDLKQEQERIVTLCRPDNRQDNPLTPPQDPGSAVPKVPTNAVSKKKKRLSKAKQRNQKATV